MENSVFRCKNLDGTFAIASDIPNEPILLIDDVCDSGWTFTVISALLRQSGSEKVFPFAVASSATNQIMIDKNIQTINGLEQLIAETKRLFSATGIKDTVAQKQTKGIL